MFRRPLILRLDRYIFRQLLVALLAVTVALVALIWLTQSLRFVALVVDRGLSLRVFLELTGLLVPSFVAVVLPITTFVVIQFIYQRLAGDRELTVMRGAGLSNLAIARPGLVLALLATIAGLGLNIWVVPASFAHFREYQFEIRNRIAAFLLQEGVFTQISPDLTVYVRSRDPDGTLRGILVDDARQKNAHATILAERGRVLSGNGPPRVLLENGSRQEIDHQTGRLNVLTFAQNVIALTDASSPGTQRMRDVSEMSLHELLHPDMKWVSPNDVGKFVVAAHQRLASPLTALDYALVALVSVLSGGFRRHGGVLRPLAAILCVVGLLALQLGVQNLATRNLALLPLVWVVAVLPALVCGVWLVLPSLRARRPRPIPAGA